MSTEREIDKIAREKFDGDVDKAIRYCVANKLMTDEIAQSLNTHESFVCLGQVEKEVDKKGGEGLFARVTMQSATLEKWHITHDDVRNTTKNPFTNDIFKWLIILVFVVIFSALVLPILPSKQHEGFAILEPTFIGLCSIELASKIVNSIKFKKIKKQITEEDEYFRLQSENGDAFQNKHWIKRASNEKCLKSFVLGLAGLPFCIFGVFSILAIILGFAGIKQIKITKEDGKGKAIIGIITGFIGAIAFLFFLLILIVSIFVV